MLESAAISQLARIAFLAYTVLASAYWVEAARWSDKVALMPPGRMRDKCLVYKIQAELIFRFCTAIMVVTILALILPIFIEAAIVVQVCGWVSLSFLAVLLVLCMRFVFNRPIIPIDPPTDEDLQSGAEKAVTQSS